MDLLLDVFIYSVLVSEMILETLSSNACIIVSYFLSQIDLIHQLRSKLKALHEIKKDQINL